MSSGVQPALTCVESDDDFDCLRINPSSSTGLAAGSNSKASVVLNASTDLCLGLGMGGVTATREEVGWPLSS